MVCAVDICNLALSHIGDSATVESIDPPEESAQAEHCARFYPIAVSTLIGMHHWAFAMRRESLAALDMSAGAWRYAYAVPAQMISIISVGFPDHGDNADANGYSLETLGDGTSVLLTNVPDAVLHYTRHVTDSEMFPPLFVTALSWYLASLLAGPMLQGDSGVRAAQLCTKTFSTWFSQAIKNDVGKRRVRPEHRVSWIDAR